MNSASTFRAPDAAADSDGAVIAVRNLTKVFGQETAVDHVTFGVQRGSVTALLGGNGAGKTTTISMLLGLLLPTEGTIRVLGHDMVRHRHRALPRMNFSSPYVDLPGRLKVRENLVVYGHLYGVRDVKARVAQLAEELDITRLLDRPNNKLSAGQKTRVALAKSLINEPDLLLLDEPTASLDPDTGDWIRSYLKAYQRRTGATVFLASHNMAEVERLCDDVMVMRAGRIHDRGTPTDLVARYGRRTLEEVFLDIARGHDRRTRHAVDEGDTRHAPAPEQGGEAAQ